MSLTPPPEYGDVSATFAVLDGAQFRNLRSDLERAELKFKALFLDEQKVDAAKSVGPHVVAVSDQHALKAVTEIVGTEPAVVWWVWPNSSGQAALEIYKHLRKINMVEIPIPEGEGGDMSHEKALFRHADPRVMARFIPVLEREQILQLMGAAFEISFDPGEGFQYLLRPEDA